jgi:hypothetical protein
MRTRILLVTFNLLGVAVSSIWIFLGYIMFVGIVKSTMRTRILLVTFNLLGVAAPLLGFITY